MKRGLAIAAPSRPARSPRSEDGGECDLGDRGGGGLAVKQAMNPMQSENNLERWENHSRSSSFRRVRHGGTAGAVSWKM